MCRICFTSCSGPVCRPCHVAFVEGKRPVLEMAKGGGAFASAATTAMGTQAEGRFMDLCHGRGFSLRTATSYENRRLHFDFVARKPNGTFSRVEVKAMKASYRGGPPNPNIIYIETKNIVGGDGWVYGAADEIAFEQPWGFLIVPRVALVEMVAYYKARVDRADRSGIPYTLYGRKERQDEVLVLRTEDLYRLRVTKLM